MAKFELEYIFIEGTVACWGSFESLFKIFFTVFFLYWYIHTVKSNLPQLPLIQLIGKMLTIKLLAILLQAIALILTPDSPQGDCSLHLALQPTLLCLTQLLWQTW